MAGRISASTERALRRISAGERPIDAARAEGVDPSTLWRAKKRGVVASPGRFVIVGAGALGRELKQWIEKCRSEPAVFLDDKASGPGVIGSIDNYERLDGDEVLIAIAEPREREAVTDRFSTVGTFVASSAMTGNCSIGAGSMLLPQALVSADVTLGVGCLLNTYASVGHDCVIGDFCTLSSNVNLTGRVKLGKRVFIGTGAVIIPGIEIGDDAYIGAGAVIVRDVPASTRMFGNPARVFA